MDIEQFKTLHPDLIIPEEEIFTDAKKPTHQVFALTLKGSVIYVLPKNVMRLTVAAPEMLKSDLYTLTAQRALLEQKGVIWKHLSGVQWNPDVYITLYNWIKKQQYG